MNVCGFVVVRNPDENYYVDDSGIWPRQPPRIGKRYYGGAWRMPWCDIDFELYDRKLPKDIRALYTTNVIDVHGSGFSTCTNVEVANRLLRYCNRERQKCEIIAVYSPTLAAMKGEVHVHDNILVRRGLDPFQIGGGSLLIDGIFGSPDLFPGWAERLNDNGLLNTEDEVAEYISIFRHAVSAGLLEELFPTDISPVEAVQILGKANGMGTLPSVTAGLSSDSGSP